MRKSIFRNKNAFLITLTFFIVLNVFDAIFLFGEQAVDLPPVSFFLFSCWVAVRNVAGYTFLTCSLVFLLGQYSRWLIVPLYAICVIVESAMIYVRRTFHADLAEIWLELLGNTSSSEIAGFLSMSTNLYTILSVLFIVLIIVAFSWLMFTARYPKVSRRSILTGLLCIFPFFVLNCLLMNWHWGIAQTSYSRFAISTIMSSRRMKGIWNACENQNLPKKLTKADANSPDVIIVLGESSTCKNWHLYGYPRPTTPRMDELSASGKLITYMDVVGTQPATVAALSLLLTDVSFNDLATGNWTLARVYQEAGFRCTLISQQYSIDDTTSTLFKIFNGCEKRISVQDYYGESVFDEKTIPLLEKVLNSSDDRPNLVFVHLAGMHYPVQNVIPPGETYFTDAIGDIAKLDANKRDRINRYDNAIRYEDKVLNGLIDMLARRKQATAFFFISDHGESPRADNWRDFHDEDVYSVPAIFWFSDEYCKEFPGKVEAFKRAASKPIQQDEMTYGLLDLGCIQSEFTNDCKANFICDDFKGRMPRRIDKGRKILRRDLK